ncbi:MAG TPA: dTDP-4-dehydrorhamnose 3,5-epimerase [Chitinophagaceae bacterium]|nr:dTDP-4-dehydrorhamnose 3,5-epimerase [Chitinophagaceae bacterium]
MKFTQAPLAGSYIIELSPIIDDRGWFARTYCKQEFEQIGHGSEWLQLNHSFTSRMGTIRGMHFQFPPHQEIKMVRCIAGKVFDVIIDLRQGSPTLFQWFGTELSAANKRMLYIPTGFAHGFQTLADNCELIYHHSSYYTPGAEGGVRYNDSRINIEWPLTVADISARDQAHPLLGDSFYGI